MRDVECWIKSQQIKQLLDFASLYPSIMRQFGISPEVFIKKDINYTPKDDEIKMASGAIYKKEPKALIPNILSTFYARRKQAKNDMKQASTEQEYYEAILERRLKEMNK